MGFSLRIGILSSISWRLALPAGALFALFAFAPAPGSIKALADSSKADKKTELRGSAAVAARQHSGGAMASAGPAGTSHVAIGARRAAEAGMGYSAIGLTGSRGSTGGYHIAMGTRRAAEAGLGSGGAIGLTGSHGSAGANPGLATRIRPPGFGIIALGDSGVIFSRKSGVHSLATARTEPGIRLASSTTAARADTGTSNQRLGATSNR